MITDYKAVSSSTIKAEDNHSKATNTKKKIIITKKTKKKSHNATTHKKQLKFSCYQDLHTRNITENGDADRYINAFITRTKIIYQSFEQENYDICRYQLFLPNKTDCYYSPNELNKTYERLAKLSVIIQNTIGKDKNENNLSENLIKELIIDLISIKQEIVKIWNKYNPVTPYEYGDTKKSQVLKLKELMLDFVQAQLFNCYYTINDDKNIQLIIDQLIEQKSTICFHLLNIMFKSNISNHENLDKLNFTDILTKFTKLEKLYNRIDYIYDRNIHSNQIFIMASLIKLFLEKICINSYGIMEDNKLWWSFVDLIGSFDSYYLIDDNYKEDIKQLYLNIDFYFNNLDNPLFKGVHTTLLTTNSIDFMQEFSDLIYKLKLITHIKKIPASLQNKNKLTSKVDVDAHQIKHSVTINAIQQKIKQLFIKYNIPTDDIDSWYDIFIEKIFIDLFFKIPYNIVVKLANWIDLSKKTEAKQQIHTKTPDDINIWLDVLTKEYEKICDDQIAWNEIPFFLLKLFNYNKSIEALRLTFGTPEIAKQKNIAILYAKTTQVFNPFLGTALLAIANKDSSDSLLTVLDMLDLISRQTDKTKYIKSSKYLTAQIITYLINQNDNLDLTKKQLLFIKAEKLYLELASSGINQAYLLLAETLATLAKTKIHEQNFLEAADLYYQASSYCKILSEVNNIEINLQDLALTSMNCFSSEADVLRKINEEQISLLQEFTTPKTTAKKSKKSCKQTSNISTKIDNHDLSKEITVAEVINWNQTYRTTSEPQITKTTQAKKTEAITQLPSRDKINNRRDFWITAKELIVSSTNLEKSYPLLVKLTKNNYFKMLESQFKDGIAQNNNWVVLFAYQNIAYYHFLQIKYAREIGNNVNNLQLFEVADSKTPKDCKAEKFTFENLSNEADLLIRKAIKLVCVDIPDIETKDFREIFLSLSPANYSDLPQIYKSQLASLASTYGHLKSLDDIVQGRRGKARLAAELYNKANKINPNRLTKKQEE